MQDENLPATRETALRTGFTILVTQNALRTISDPATAAGTRRAVERAMGLAEGVPYLSPRTMMIPDCPLTVHVDPSRRVVILMSKFPGWPAVTDNLVDELLPFCSPVTLA